MRESELEKLGTKYKLALMQARDERFTFITCDHKGTYADDVGISPDNKFAHSN